MTKKINEGLKKFHAVNIRILAAHGAEISALAWLFGVSEETIAKVLCEDIHPTRRKRGRRDESEDIQDPLPRTDD